ncbi:unnamed protein product [Nippostrongylus brasiliensis]|uniref:Neur_chan_LBD domain-containing protein n=1 Tax=Nippostrongylus brasiliensis TaxID=27835 RepID=A0A0N4XXY9_NIPBR|nr:unnamed protein product [Nippostrongylus brasiliensis]
MAVTALLLTTIFLGVFADDCTRDAEVIRQILTSDQGVMQPVNVDSNFTVDVDAEVLAMAVVAQTNTMDVDIILTRTWKDPSLYFAHLKPCHPSIDLLSHRSKIWMPKFSVQNTDSHLIRKHSTTLQVSKDGTVMHSTWVRENIHCHTNALDYPFGNTTCRMSWRNEHDSRERLQLKWKTENATSRERESNIKEVGDLILQNTSFIRSEVLRVNGVFDELTIVFDFQRAHHKVFFLFFLPSTLFMVVSWLSLILGPMAITRSILIVGSLMLLLMHYFTNMASLPATTGITAIDVWKIFSLLFVIGILLELVLVTCMASMGRSTRTCGCCRYSALFVDFVSFWTSLGIFVLFAFIFFTKGSVIVKWLNEKTLSDLNVF